jgi:magnesium transporter
MQAGLLDLKAIIPKLRRQQQQRVRITTNEPLGLAGNPRFASDDYTPSNLTKPSWQDKLWRKSASMDASLAAKRAARLNAQETPEGGDGGRIFSPSRTQAAKAALEPRLRCTEVDENGEVILVDGEFKKSELIAKVS